MNPVDHPHGGGEGKTAGGRNPVSPWGQSAKGLKQKTTKSDKFIITRRKKGVIVKWPEVFGKDHLYIQVY